MKFSIIVPCYNLAPWIKQSLDSVLAQDYPDWECIVIDDESTDNSGQILDEYARRDLRFKIIHQKNAGEGGARNAGLSVSKGEWIFFLDGDDLMLPNTLSHLADCISENDNVVRFNFCEFNDGEQPDINEELNQINLRQVDITQEIRMSEFFTYVWQHIYRRSIIEGMRFKKYKRGCDRVFLDDVLLNRVDVIKVVDLIGYGYRKRMGSAMNTVPSRQVLCDEMDHRLDIMGMIDASHKKVVYAGNGWLERYFTKVYPLISFERSCDVRAVRQEWYDRLPRLLELNGLSLRGRMLIVLANSHVLRPIGYLIIFVIPYLRSRLASIESVARFYRRIMRHGEFAHK